MFRQPAPTFDTYRRQYPVITIILGIQTIVFIMMTLSGGSASGEVLIRFGAKLNSLIDRGEWWRLITSIFIHIGFVHFLFNSFALYIFGPAAEWLFGRFRFIVLYLFAGLMGNVASYVFNPHAISAGASGAIYGLFGMYAYLYMKERRYVDEQTGKGIIALIIINLLLSFGSGIDLAAHVGGLVTGWLLTPLLLKRKTRKMY